MTMFRWTLLVVAWFLLVPDVFAEDTRGPDPLFQNTEILEVSISAPMSTLLKDRPEDEELAGTLQFKGEVGDVLELDIQIRTRGRFRRELDICRFPPLRLNFKKSQTKDTLFHKQDKLKLVTHCQNSSKYEQVLLREYAAYRILNVVTDASFQTRLLRITYVDNEGKKADTVRYGILIEHEDRLSKRLGKDVLHVKQISVKTLDAEYASIVSMFHYLIGNTDFSPIQGPEDRLCCHNHVLMGNENEPVLSVPYDFDQAGLVGAPHAGPSPKFRIRSVKQRLYRGRCIHNDYLDATIERFRGKKDEILAAVQAVDMARKRTVTSMTGYIEKFYETLRSERRIQSAFVRDCV